MVRNGNIKHQSVLERKNYAIERICKIYTTSKNLHCQMVLFTFPFLQPTYTNIPIYQYIQSAQKKKKVVSHNFVRQLDSETKKSI